MRNISPDVMRELIEAGGEERQLSAGDKTVCVVGSSATVEWKNGYRIWGGCREVKREAGGLVEKSWKWIQGPPELSGHFWVGPVTKRISLSDGIIEKMCAAPVLKIVR